MSDHLVLLWLALQCQHKFQRSLWLISSLVTVPFPLVPTASTKRHQAPLPGAGADPRRSELRSISRLINGIGVGRFHFTLDSLHWKAARTAEISALHSTQMHKAAEQHGVPCCPHQHPALGTSAPASFPPLWIGRCSRSTPVPSHTCPRSRMNSQASSALPPTPPAANPSSAS